MNNVKTRFNTMLQLIKSVIISENKNLVKVSVNLSYELKVDK